MPSVAPNKPKNTGESSDWTCTNCGATLSNVNNNEIALHAGSEYNCICSAGKFIATRNSPLIKPPSGRGAQKRNQGGDVSFPGP